MIPNTGSFFCCHTCHMIRNYTSLKTCVYPLSWVFLLGFILRWDRGSPRVKTAKVNLPRSEFIPWGIQGTMLGRGPSVTGGWIHSEWIYIKIKRIETYNTFLYKKRKYHILWVCLEMVFWDVYPQLQLKVLLLEIYFVKKKCYGAN